MPIRFRTPPNSRLGGSKLPWLSPIEIELLISNGISRRLPDELLLKRGCKACQAGFLKCKCAGGLVGATKAVREKAEAEREAKVGAFPAQAAA